MAQPLKVILVAGTRPNFIKIAPLLEALRGRPASFAPFLVHTGQHYDDALSKVFFEELEIPRPDWNLGVGSGPQGQQTAQIMLQLEPLLADERPAAVIVVGDVNSTMAAALVAAKMTIPVVHVEAGLRSFDRTMPEELNRLVTDALSDLLFVSEPSGMENLSREGLDPRKVHLVGNVMIDTLRNHREKAERSKVLSVLGLVSRNYGVLTLHRPSNVDHPETLRRILVAVGAIGGELPMVLPLHPRTLDRISRLGLGPAIETTPGLRLVPPQGYLDFLKLQAEARLVLTDSGGVQEETTVLGVPCLTIRENTERPITLTQGTNVLVGTDPDRIVAAARRVLGGEARLQAGLPDLWDGRAAQRIAGVLEGALRC
jgi:UDP-N-acetylglucosamine 2-epimerase (non-hydrolysing)